MGPSQLDSSFTTQLLYKYTERTYPLTHFLSGSAVLPVSPKAAHPGSAASAAVQRTPRCPALCGSTVAVSLIVPPAALPIAVRAARPARGVVPTCFARKPTPAAGRVAPAASAVSVVPCPLAVAPTAPTAVPIPLIGALAAIAATVAPRASARPCWQHARLWRWSDVGP
jgi:hypothetical protein